MKIFVVLVCSLALGIAVSVFSKTDEELHAQTSSTIEALEESGLSPNDHWAASELGLTNIKPAIALTGFNLAERNYP